MIDRAQLKSRAKAAVKKNYWGSVIASVLFLVGTYLMANVLSPFRGPGVTIGDDSASLTTYSVSPVYLGLYVAMAVLVMNPLLVGIWNFFVKNARNRGALRDILPSNYGNVVVGMLMKNIFIFLWSCLLIVPGIIKMYEYRMVPFLLTDDPDLGWKEAMNKSKEMMLGNKMDTFILDLSFLGWVLLGGCTCGILSIFWVNPYVYATGAELYLSLGGTRKDYQPVNFYTDGNEAAATVSAEGSQGVEQNYKAEENTNVSPITPPNRVSSIYEKPEQSIHPIIPPERR